MRKPTLIIIIILISIVAWHSFQRDTHKAQTPPPQPRIQAAQITHPPSPNNIMLEKCILQYKAKTPIPKLKAEMCENAVMAFTAETLPKNINADDYTALKQALQAQ